MHAPRSGNAIKWSSCCLVHWCQTSDNTSWTPATVWDLLMEDSDLWPVRGVHLSLVKITAAIGPDHRNESEGHQLWEVTYLSHLDPCCLYKVTEKIRAHYTEVTLSPRYIQGNLSWYCSSLPSFSKPTSYCMSSKEADRTPHLTRVKTFQGKLAHSYFL